MEELGRGGAVGLWVGGCSGGGSLRGREVGNALRGLVFDVWDVALGHFAVVKKLDVEGNTVAGL